MSYKQKPVTGMSHTLKTHLERYPDIKVIVPEELAQSASDTPGMLSAERLSAPEMKSEVDTQLGDWSESSLINSD